MKIARLPSALALALLAAGAVPLPAAADDVAAGPPEFTPKVREAVERGLEYLRRSQRPDGAWEGNVGFKINEGYHVTSRGPVRDPGITALAGTAFLSGGHLPGRGPYGEVLNRAVAYIVGDGKDPARDPSAWPGVVDEKGYISENGTRMYSHAFATLFLAEVYGSSLDRSLNERVREKLTRAVKNIVDAQNDQGGWRYEPNAADSDMSVTVCQVMALRAARNKGIRVPQKVIDAAIGYVLESAVTRNQGRPYWRDGSMRRGAFKYQYREPDRNQIPTRASLALTGAAMTTLFGAGLYDDGAIESWARDHGLARFGRGGERLPTLAEMSQYILDEYEDHAQSYPRHYFYFYGHYYACQAMYIAGGRWWEDYYPRVRSHLLRTQDPDGSWEVQYVGRNFGTAAACVILQVPCRLLPVLDQR